jgi:hypothetical protein
MDAFDYGVRFEESQRLVRGVSNDSAIVSGTGGHIRGEGREKMR